jgi:hypothetical protein
MGVTVSPKSVAMKLPRRQLLHLTAGAVAFASLSHIADEHDENMPPSMYEYFRGAVWQRKKIS